MGNNNLYKVEKYFIFEKFNKIKIFKNWLKGKL